MRVLVPLDFNAPSRHACDWAIQHLCRIGAGQIFYLHVLESGADNDLDDLKELEDDVEGMKRLAEEETTRTLGAGGAPPGVEVRYVVARGRPEQQIVQKAQELGVELVVMGTHGRKGFDRLYLGSVAEKVVRNATCTVVVVKARPSDLARGEAPHGDQAP